MNLKIFVLISLLGISLATADDTPSVPRPKPVEIKISAGPETHAAIVNLNGVDYPLTASPEARVDFEAHLKEQYKSTPTASVIIRADKNVDYAQMKQLVDLCSESGFPSVNVAIPPESKIELPPDMIQAAQQGNAPQSLGLSWASLTVIILVSSSLLLFVVIGLILFFVLRRNNKSRHEKELRRIASLDS